MSRQYGLDKRVTNSGRPPEIEDGPAPAGVNPKTGQNYDYWVLSDEERAKGFARPVRFKYIHKTCGTETIIKSTKIAETYARDPKFYGATFCVRCGKHLPVEEFVWSDTNIEVGT